MTNFETLKQILSTHPKVQLLECNTENDYDFGRLNFIYEDEVMSVEVTILFNEDEVYETKIK